MVQVFTRSEHQCSDQSTWYFSALRACHRPRFAKISRSFRENFSKTLARKFFRKADLVDAINLVQKSSKSELSSRFLSRSKFWGAKKVEFSKGRLPPKDGSIQPQNLGKRVSGDPQHFVFRRRKRQKHRAFAKLWTAIYPRWLRSASNFGKTHFRWSPIFTFRRWQQILVKMFDKIFCRKIGKLPVSEELWFFGRDRPMRLEKWPPKFWFSARHDFWQRGKSGTNHLWSWLLAKNDFRNKSDLRSYEIMIFCSVLARRHICFG